MTAPLVSLVLTTHNRRVFARQALVYAARQTYRPLELVLIDASEEPFIVPEEWIFDDAPKTFANLTFRCVHPRIELGPMRNAGVEAATGKYVVHMDDDDWYAPDYVAEQVRMLGSGWPLAGFVDNFWYDVPLRRGWARQMPPTSRRSIAGCCMAYVRQYALDHPFGTTLPEDTNFVDAARARGDLCACSGNRQYVVYIRHVVQHSPWEIRPSGPDHTQGVRTLFGPDASFYDGLSELMPPKRGVASPDWHLPPPFRR